MKLVRVRYHFFGIILINFWSFTIWAIQIQSFVNWVPKLYESQTFNLIINKVNLSNGKVVLAPSLCGENCFRVIRDMSDCISFPDERNESLLVIFKKPIWPPSGNKNRYREYGIENLPHEAPGAPKIFRFERLNIFISAKSL